MYISISKFDALRGEKIIKREGEMMSHSQINVSESGRWYTGIRDSLRFQFRFGFKELSQSASK
jgi:hypothetical protein